MKPRKLKRVTVEIISEVDYIIKIENSNICKFKVEHLTYIVIRLCLHLNTRF